LFDLSSGVLDDRAPEIGAMIYVAMEDKLFNKECFLNMDALPTFLSLEMFLHRS
jgi:hypothetical protein